MPETQLEECVREVNQPHARNTILNKKNLKVQILNQLLVCMIKDNIKSLETYRFRLTFSCYTSYVLENPELSRVLVYL